jgi:hypothetical protein
MIFIFVKIIMEDNKNIFIHIPKTGGTTINTAMNKTSWQTEVNFNYRHILKETKYSNSGDIFLPENFLKYSRYNIFMMFRNPVDRIVSEYYFLKERQEFVNLLKPSPKNFEEFYRNKQSTNYMVGFLVGKRIYDTNYTTRKDLDKVVKAIESIPIHVGIFENYEESMAYFKSITGIDWGEKVEAKRMTLSRPKVSELKQEIIDEIMALNSLDVELYQYGLTLFENASKNIKKLSVKIEKSKYNHIMQYVKNFILFEFCMNNRNYLKQNIHYFNGLNKALRQRYLIEDGESFCATWNASFVESVSRAFPGSDFYKQINLALLSSKEPLENTIAIANAVDLFFKIEGKKADKYYKEMSFDPSCIIRVKVEKPKEEKISLFKKLFKIS